MIASYFHLTNWNKICIGNIVSIFHRCLFLFLILPCLAAASDDCRSSDDELLSALRELNNKIVFELREKDDVFPRSFLLYEIFLDSKKTYDYALLASHASMQVFQNKVQYLTRLNKTLKLLHNHPRIASDGKILLDHIMLANRNLVYETSLWYYFFKKYGCNPMAIPVALRFKSGNEVLREKVYRDFVLLHQKLNAGNIVPKETRQEILRNYNKFEQEVLIQPIIDTAQNRISRNNRNLFASLFTIKFPFFSKGEMVKYKDFFSSDERIEWTFYVATIGEKAGIETVEKSLGLYEIEGFDFFYDFYNFERGLYE